MEPTFLATSAVPAGATGLAVTIVGIVATAVWIALFWR
jgi:hypothetical protein